MSKEWAGHNDSVCSELEKFLADLGTARLTLKSDPHYLTKPIYTPSGELKGWCAYILVGDIEDPHDAVDSLTEATIWAVDKILASREAESES